MLDINQDTLNRLATLIADQVAMKLANRPIAKTPQLPVGALSKVDAAAYLGVSIRTVENYIAAGKLEPVMQGTKGTKVTLRIGDLDELLAAKQKA